MTSFYCQYASLLDHILSTGDVETNARTGHKVAVLPGGTSLRVDLGEGTMPVCGVRKLFPRTAAAEVAWFVSGSQQAEWFQRFSKVWDKFVEPDGTLEAAYGYRWRGHFGRDQLGLAVEALQEDPSDRRVLVSTWDPRLDGLGEIGQRSVPCLTHFTLSMTAGRLHSSLFLRSSDVFVGLPYDVLGHSLLMSILAKTLDVRLGVMHVTLAHAHLYEDHWEMAREALAGSDHARNGPLLPTDWTLRRVGSYPDEFVEAVTRAAREGSWGAWPKYSPKPFVVE